MKSAFSTAAGACAAFAVFVSGSSAQVAIPAADRAGALPGFSGDGLNGTIWFGEAGGSIAGAESIMAGVPAGAMRSTQVDYPNGATTIVAVGQPLSDFLGVDGASVLGFDPAGVDSGAKVFTFVGLIAIPEAGAFGFGVGSDDGMRLRIGSMIVTQNDGDRGFGLSTETATFTEPGLYPIELLYWANGAGESGVELLWNAGSTQPLSVVPQASLYTIPSPGSVALLGVAGLTLVRRRR